jgi:exosortase
MDKGAAAFLLAIWAVVFLVGSHAWRFGDYYDYGWYVPPLALVIFFTRWRQLPAAHVSSRSWWIPLLFIAPLWWVARVFILFDPAWRLPQWILAGLALVATHLVVCALKGRGASHALLPVAAFALTALPLPSLIEHSLIHHLSSGVIQLAAGIFNFFGRPVLVFGDRMESLGEWVEVADGCSGIRSLQGFLMVALFFGEWFRLGGVERGLLVVLSLGCVWLANVARALVLAWLRFEHGLPAFDRWHDASGALAFAAGAGAVWWLAHRLEPRLALKPKAPPLAAGVDSSAPRRPAGMRAAWWGAGALVAIEVAALFWANPRPPEAGPVLAIVYPLPGVEARFDRAGFEKVRPTLRCSAGWMASVGEDRGARRMRAGWFSWDLTDGRSVLEAFQHSPEVCMGAIGWSLLGNSPSRRHDLGERQLEFDVTEFKDPTDGGSLYVFKTVWISGARDASLRGGISGLGSAEALRIFRLAMAVQRFKPAHARVLMGVVAGEADEAAAWQRFGAEVLTGLYLREPAASGPPEMIPKP